MKFRHVLCSVILIATFLVSSSSAQSIPSNVQLNHDATSFLQNEEQIWICSTDSLVVIADWRDWRLGFRRVGFAVSTDAGVTWGTDSLAIGMYSRQSDPCLTGDRLGTFYMNMLDYEPGGESVVSVFRSTNKGQSWTGPVATGLPGPYFEDKQFTTADRTGGAHDGNYYMSWTRFPNSGPAVIMFVRSTDGAQNFWPPITVGPRIQSACGTFSQGQGSIPLVNADGTVHVFWSGYDIDSSCSIPLNRSFAIRRASSSTGGLSFEPDQAMFPSNAYFQVIDGGVDVYGFPMADADLSNGPHHGTIYIAHTQYVSGYSGETDIQVRRSTDNGLSWSDPVIANDDPPGRNIDQFHPWLTVNQDGVITMVFYDQRTDPAGHFLFDCYFTASFDGAETFTRNYRLSEVSINPNFLESARNTLAAEPAWTPTWENPGGAFTAGVMAGAIAEYIGVHAYHDHVVAVWTDTRNGNQDVFSTQFTIPFLAPRLYEPPDSAVTPDATPEFRWSTCWHESQDFYRLEITRDPSFTVIDYSYPALGDNRFTPSTSLSSDLHYWRVKAFRPGGDSTAYSESRVLSPACVGGAPPVLGYPSLGDTVDVAVVDFVWEAVGDAIQYQFQLSGDPGFGTTIVDSTLPVLGLQVAGLSDSSEYFWRVRSTNACTTGTWAQTQFTLAICPIAITGDVNVSGAVTSSDVIELVNYVFKSGASPRPVSQAGDVDCDSDVDSGDIIYLVNYTFKGGPPPCDACSVI